MAKNSLLWEQPVETLKEAVAIKERIAALEARFSSLFRAESDVARRRKAGRRLKESSLVSKRRVSQAAGKRRRLSHETRAKLAASAKKRWAVAKKAGKSSL